MHVDAYKRADGTKVRAHSRWAAGARREMTVLAVVALVAIGFGSTGAGSAGGSGEQPPRPRSTSPYPVKLPGWEEPTRPSPSVSYPIKFDAS